MCCGLKPSHPEPHSLRPQPINLNIIRNGGIHSRSLLCSRSRLSVRSWRLCSLPGTVDAAPVRDDEDRLLKGCNHHEGCVFKKEQILNWGGAITLALLSTELWPSKVHVFCPLWKMDHHSGLWCARRPFCVMHTVSKITFVSNPGDTLNNTEKLPARWKKQWRGEIWLHRVTFRGKNSFLKPFWRSPVSKTRIQIQCRVTLSPLWLGALRVVRCHRSQIFIVEFSPLPFKLTVALFSHTASWVTPTGDNSPRSFRGVVFTLQLQSPACLNSASHLLQKLSPTFHQPVTSPLYTPTALSRKSFVTWFGQPSSPLPPAPPLAFLCLKHDF